MALDFKQADELMTQAASAALAALPNDGWSNAEVVVEFKSDFAATMRSTLRYDNQDDVSFKKLPPEVAIAMKQLRSGMGSDEEPKWRYSLIRFTNGDPQAKFEFTY